jgi:hypothetical protein
LVKHDGDEQEGKILLLVMAIGDKVRGEMHGQHVEAVPVSFGQLECGRSG